MKFHTQALVLALPLALCMGATSASAGTISSFSGTYNYVAPTTTTPTLTAPTYVAPTITTTTTTTVAAVDPGCYEEPADAYATPVMEQMSSIEFSMLSDAFADKAPADCKGAGHDTNLCEGKTKVECDAILAKACVGKKDGDLVCGSGTTAKGNKYMCVIECEVK